MDVPLAGGVPVLSGSAASNHNAQPVRFVGEKLVTFIRFDKVI